MTDLFKIYKTRIWMSAINPASFVTPSAGLQLPSGLGPGAITGERDPYSGSRHKREHMAYIPTTVAQGTINGYDAIWNAGTEIPVSTSMIPNAYAQFYQPQALQQLNMNLNDYSHRLQQPMRSSSPFGSQSYGAFTGIPQPAVYKSEDKSGASRSSYTNQMNDWNTSFQGLSLGS